MKRPKKTNIQNIAKACGVSTMTVSRVINDSSNVAPATRKKVERLIAKLDYHPSSVAQRMAGVASNSLCILSEQDSLRRSVFSITFDSEILRLLIAESSVENYRIVISPTHQTGKGKAEFAKLAEEGSVFGFILLDLIDHDTRLQTLQNLNLPVVLLGRCSIPPGNFYAVGVNDEKGGYVATKYLIDQGRKRIALLCFQIFSTPAINRLNGYKRALLENGQPIDESIICFNFRINEEISGYEGMKQILSGENVPDAVFCTSDLRAIGAMRAIHEAGYSIPDDIAIMGFDGLPVSELCNVPITTIRQPFLKIAEKTIGIFNDLTHGEPPIERVHVFDGELIIRNST